MIWKVCAFFGSKTHDADNHGGLAGVQTHENGIHLYKSPEAKSVALRQMADYAFAGWLLAWLGGINVYTVMPLFLMSI